MAKSGPRELGQIEAIKASQSANLPRDGEYHMLFRDYSNYDLVNEDGQIDIYDLNYDEYLIAEATITNASVSNLDLYEMPEPIATLREVTTHFCDLNSNGNVTYGECVRCMLNSCYQNEECAALCSIANAINRSCTGSISISCSILAIFY